MIPTMTAPAKLHAFALLVRAGLPRAEVMRHLKIARSTYFARLKELKTMEREAIKLARGDP